MLNHIKLKKIIKFLDEDIKAFVIASIKVNIFYFIIGYIIAFDLSSLIAVHVSIHLGVLLVFLISFLVPIVIWMRRAGIGIKEDGLLILHLKLLKMESKKVFAVPIDKIRSITVSKFIHRVKLKISFISEDGRLEQHKYGFSTFVIGSEERKKYAEQVYKKLVAIQKIVDKGDF